jgi:hypothetical protein
VITVLRRSVIKECPYRHETDFGNLAITIPGGAPELHGLAAKIDALTATPVSHEDFTAQVAELLPAGTRVTTTWQTGPWSVEVTEGGQAP